MLVAGRNDACYLIPYGLAPEPHSCPGAILNIEEIVVSIAVGMMV
jgi:hypothetical protein